MSLNINESMIFFENMLNKEFILAGNVFEENNVLHSDSSETCKVVNCKVEKKVFVNVSNNMVLTERVFACPDCVQFLKVYSSVSYKTFSFESFMEHKSNVIVFKNKNHSFKNMDFTDGVSYLTYLTTLYNSLKTLFFQSLSSEVLIETNLVKVNDFKNVQFENFLKMFDLEKFLLNETLDVKLSMNEFKNQKFLLNLTDVIYFNSLLTFSSLYATNEFKTIRELCWLFLTKNTHFSNGWCEVPSHLIPVFYHYKMFEFEAAWNVPVVIVNENVTPVMFEEAIKLGSELGNSTIMIKNQNVILRNYIENACDILMIV